MKTLTITTLLVALAAPALAQHRAEDHSAHHPAAAGSAAVATDMTDGEVRKVDKEAAVATGARSGDATARPDR